MAERAQLARAGDAATQFVIDGVVDCIKRGAEWVSDTKDGYLCINSGIYKAEGGNRVQGQNLKKEAIRKATEHVVEYAHKALDRCAFQTLTTSGTIISPDKLAERCRILLNGGDLTTVKFDDTHGFKGAVFAIFQHITDNDVYIEMTSPDLRDFLDDIAVKVFGKTIVTSGPWKMKLGTINDQLNKTLMVAYGGILQQRDIELKEVLHNSMRDIVGKLLHFLSNIHVTTPDEDTGTLLRRIKYTVILHNMKTPTDNTPDPVVLRDFSDGIITRFHRVMQDKEDLEVENAELMEKVLSTPETASNIEPFVEVLVQLASALEISDDIVPQLRGLLADKNTDVGPALGRIGTMISSSLEDQAGAGRIIMGRGHSLDASAPDLDGKRAVGRTHETLMMTDNTREDVQRLTGAATSAQQELEHMQQVIQQAESLRAQAEQAARDIVQMNQVIQQREAQLSDARANMTMVGEQLEETQGLVQEMTQQHTACLETKQRIESDIAAAKIEIQELEKLLDQQTRQRATALAALHETDALEGGPSRVLRSNTFSGSEHGTFGRFEPRRPQTNSFSSRGRGQPGASAKNGARGGKSD